MHEVSKLKVNSYFGYDILVQNYWDLKKYKLTSEGTDTVNILFFLGFRIPLCVMITSPCVNLLLSDVHM